MNSLTYDAAQKEAIESGASRTIVIAGPGAGKTRTLVGRIQHQLKQGVSPSRIVAVTFTCAAAAVIQERLGVKIGYAGTLHSFLYRLICRHAELLGLGDNPAIVDEERAADILNQVRLEQRYKGSDASIKEALQDRTKHSNPTPAQLVAIAYCRRLRNSNALDFDSIIAIGKDLLTKHRANLFWQYDEVLIDEAQDASEAFFDIYEAFPCKRLFMVGDADQSIMSFMGASDRFQRTANLPWHGSNRFRLETNYRSATSICATAQTLIEKNAGRFPKRISPRNDAPAGHVELVECKGEEEEVKFIAMKIRELQCEQSCAVLVRTNALREQYALALAAYGIPIASKSKQTEPADWRIVKSFLSCLSAPENDMAAEGFLIALRGKDAAEQSRREAITAQTSINQHCLHLPQLDRAFDALMYFSNVTQNKKPSAESLAKLEAAHKLLYEDSTTADLLIALSEKINIDEPVAGVRVITLHSAKGQEFNTVFMPAFCEGIIPSSRDANDAAALRESRRLAYVGFTRAEQNLFVSYTQTRQERFGRRECLQQMCSRFAAEAELGNER